MRLCKKICKQRRISTPARPAGILKNPVFSRDDEAPRAFALSAGYCKLKLLTV
jgi:hypothetical protein